MSAEAIISPFLWLTHRIRECEWLAEASDRPRVGSHWHRPCMRLKFADHLELCRSMSRWRLVRGSLRSSRSRAIERCLGCSSILPLGAWYHFQSNTRNDSVHRHDVARSRLLNINESEMKLNEMKMKKMCVRSRERGGGVLVMKRNSLETQWNEMTEKNSAHSEF